jgi:hypothetical protein
VRVTISFAGLGRTLPEKVDLEGNAAFQDRELIT